MSKHYESVLAVCPYYRYDSPQVITCEGAAEGSCLHLAFRNKAECFAYKKKHCKDDFKSCIVAKLLSEENKDD